MERKPPPDPRTPSTGQPVKIFSIKHNDPTSVRFLGPIAGLVTHWQSGRSEVCEGDNCPAARHKCRSVFKAFGPVEVWDRIDEVWRPEVLEVTENLEEILRGRDLRGEVWLLTRPYVKGNSDPVNGQLLEKLDPRTLRKAFDIVPILTRNFRPVHKLLLGACNPNPPRVYLEPSTGAPPKLPADLIPDEPRPPSPAEQKKIKEMLAELRGTGTRKEKDGARAHEGNGHSHDQAGRNGR